MQTVTFMGNGNMALSIAQGLKRHYSIEVVGRNMHNLELFEKNLGIKIDKYLLDGFNIDTKKVILCVKPHNTQSVAEQLKGKAEVLYSVLAGTSIKTLKSAFNTHAVVRAMPNLAASVGASMTTLTGDISYQKEGLTLLGTIGETLWLGSEKELDIATALAGSGPAYLALIAEALTDGAVRQGLKREDAMKTMRGLFGGFGMLIQDIHPALLKDGVMSAGGTTAAGYSVLEEGGVRASCINAITKAHQKAQAL